jgi:hypothetical protein
MIKYPLLRSIHLLVGASSLAFLLMYGISAVQMAHNSWFRMTPAVHEERIRLAPRIAGARQLARELMDRGVVRGEILQTATTPLRSTVRIVRPGTVHDVSYDAASGITMVKTSIAGFMGMLNRLHHAAGLYHGYALLNVWGWAVAIVSILLIALGVTGIWMWWLRRQDRMIGLVLLGANLVFSITVLVLIRSAGP